MKHWMMCNQLQVLRTHYRLENKLESEMPNLGNMVKDLVAGLTEHVNQKLSETDGKFQNLLALLAETT